MSILRPVLSPLVCQAGSATPAPPSPPASVKRVLIVDTDGGTDCDDVMALAIAVGALKEKAVSLPLVVATTKPGPIYGNQVAPSMRAFLDTVLPGNTIEVATFKGEAPDLSGDAEMNIVLNRDFGIFGDQTSRFGDAVAAYRRVLVAAANKAAVILIVGAASSLAALLASPADDISPLTGAQLAATKIGEVVWQAGEFPGGGGTFNAEMDKAAAAYVAANWPAGVPFTFAGNEFGGPVNTGPTPGLSPMIDPLTASFVAFFNREDNLLRNSWDPAAALYAAYGVGGAIEYGETGGTVTFANGANTWTPGTGGPFRYLRRVGNQFDPLGDAINAKARAVEIKSPAVVADLQALDFSGLGGFWYRPSDPATVIGAGMGLTVQDISGGGRHATVSTQSTNGGPQPTAPILIPNFSGAFSGLAFDGVADALQFDAAASLFDTSAALKEMHLFFVVQLDPVQQGEAVLLDFTQADTDNHYLNRVRLRTNNNGGLFGGRVGNGTDGEFQNYENNTGAIRIFEMRVSPNIPGTPGFNALVVDNDLVKKGEGLNSPVRDLFAVNAGRMMLSNGNGFDGLPAKGTVLELAGLPAVLRGQDRRSRVRYVARRYSLDVRA
jgi:hypothetical protein